MHSNLVQRRQYALLKSTSQRHCISNVRHGYGLDAVTTWRGFASARNVRPTGIQWISDHILVFRKYQKHKKYRKISTQTLNTNRLHEQWLTKMRPIKSSLFTYEDKLPISTRHSGTRALVNHGVRLTLSYCSVSHRPPWLKHRWHFETTRL
jgi:hypothetical protein